MSTRVRGTPVIFREKRQWVYRQLERWYTSRTIIHVHVNHVRLGSMSVLKGSARNTVLFNYYTHSLIGLCSLTYKNKDTSYIRSYPFDNITEIVEWQKRHTCSKVNRIDGNIVCLNCIEERHAYQLAASKYMTPNSDKVTC